jgi:ankyrin repeat protein
LDQTTPLKVGDSTIQLSEEDHEGQMPLMRAAFQEHESVVGLLLANGARVDARDLQGRTAPSLAVTRDSQGVVKLLLDKKGDIRGDESLRRFRSNNMQSIRLKTHPVDT